LTVENEFDKNAETSYSSSMRMAKDKEEKCSLHIAATVVKNIRLCNEHYCLTLKNDTLAKTTKPGQFVNLRIDGRDDLLLRRPFSVAMTRPPQSLFEIVYRVVGQGTRSMTELSRGEKVDLIGPLGTGFHLPEEPTNCLLVGGGVGIAPLWGLAAQLSKKKNEVIALLGFRSSDNVFGEDIFRKLRVETIVTTDDGSYGLKGFVSDHLEKVLNRSVGHAYVCGPNPMLKAVLPMIRKSGIKGEVSLEERMGCGYGVCLSCVANIIEDGVVEKKRICTEGPVFDLEHVVLSDEP
jgi:dihydroorotate dehydrogenase electron transfer subunit